MVRAGVSKKIVYSKIPWQRWGKRAEVMNRYMQTIFRDLQQKGEVSSAHHFGHVQRVSYYAGQYIKLMGGGKKKAASWENCWLHAR